MYKRLMVVILTGFCLSLLSNTVNSAPVEKIKPTQLPEDQVPVSSGFTWSDADFCVIQNDDEDPKWFVAGFDSGYGVAVYMDPEKCPGQVPYPFKITDVHFLLYGGFSESTVWPVKMRVRIRGLYEFHECNGPGDVLFSELFAIPVDSGVSILGRPMNLSLSQPVCTSQPFFLELEYETLTDTDHPLPSLLFDLEVASQDSCNNWGLEYGIYYRWPDFWIGDPPGDPIIRATGYAKDQECWYWKQNRENAPSGMPDFGQYQFDDSLALCGPAAIANCLWWFDAVPPGMKPADFIRLLSDYFHSDLDSGTYVDSIQSGLDRYFNDYGFSLYEHTFSQPEFHAVEDSLQRSQDIILLLGFWQQPDQWVRFGGHFITMSGVCSDSYKVAFSDPARDAAEYGWPGRVRPLEHPPHTDGDSVHNDPEYISHDIYQAIMESPSPGGLWSLPDYYMILEKSVEFEGQNFQPGQEIYFDSYMDGLPVFTEIEYAIMICPSNWYWKPDTPPKAPSGMPDFDQNQGDWVNYCGPTAVANCLWWFDASIDAVPDGWTPPQLIDTLAARMHCNPAWGTYVDTMQLALEQYFQDYRVALQESTFHMPDFLEMEDSLKRCQDIILLLGFWEEVEPGYFVRRGGHYVTMAGVCSESLKIAFSDPYWDNAESGGPGRVRPPHAPHADNDTLHNDPAYVSQDIYTSTLTSPSPGNHDWGLLGYPPDKSSIQNFIGKNFHPDQLQYYQPDLELKGPIYTEVEWAVMICPKTTGVEEEEESAITPKDFKLYQSYPNPFNNQTVIKYNLRKSCQVTLSIFNILGQKVKTLVNEDQEAGPKIVNWDGKNEKGEGVASGIYFYQLKAGEVTQTRRMVLLK